MDSIKEQKCPDCGAAMRFDPLSDKLVCDYCGKIMEIVTPKEEPANVENISEQADTVDEEKKEKEKKEKSDTSSIVEGFDFNSLNEMASRPDAESLPIFNCVSCGAEVIAPAEQMATTCPYCGNNIVLTQKASGTLRPDGLQRAEAQEGGRRPSRRSRAQAFHASLPGGGTGNLPGAGQGLFKQ